MTAVPLLAVDELRLVPLQRKGITSDQVGTANIVSADILGNGSRDIISCAAGSPFIIERKGGVLQNTWLGPSVDCVAVTAGDAAGDGSIEVIVASWNYIDSTAKLMLFDARSLGQPTSTVSIPGTQTPSDVAIGNVDAEPNQEIVVTTAGATYVYDATTLDVQWTAAGYGGTDVAIADVDGDSKLEIVVNGTTGSVLDGEAETLKWGYVGGFGDTMAVGNVDGDARAEIVFATYGGGSSRQINILHGDTFATSSFNTNFYYITSISIGDGDADGTNEIVYGSGSWEGVRGVAPADGTILWSVVPQSAYTVTGLCLTDVDGDNKSEVVWGAGLGSSSKDYLIVADPVTETVEWSGNDPDGPFMSAVGDLDGDGALELVLVSAASDSGYSGGIIEVFDALTGISKGTMPQQSLDVSAVAIGQVDADPAKEVITLAGSYSSDMRVMVWDGITYANEWSSAIPPYSSPTFVSRVLAVANIDGDAVDEIFVGTSDSKVTVLNGASNIIQTSKVVDGSVRVVALANLDADAALELIVGTTARLYAIDTQTWVGPDVLMPDVVAVAGTAAENGLIAMTSAYPRLALYDAALNERWACTNFVYGETLNAVAFASLNGATQVLTGGERGVLRLYDIDGVSCPETVEVDNGTAIHALAFAELTGDDRPDLVVSTRTGGEVLLTGTSSEERGDVDDDGVIHTDDIDRLVDYLFGAEPGISTSADFNDDQRISAEDAFALISYELAGGAPPAP